jgi:hypothetical protein
VWALLLAVILPPSPSILEGELVSIASRAVILSPAPSILDGELDVSYLACCEAINSNEGLSSI